MLLCGGDQDPTVFYFNTQLMQSYWATHKPAGAVSVLDVAASPSGSGLDAQLQLAFAAAQAVVAAEGGEAAVLARYHTELVAPFCVAAVRSFFDGL